MDVLMDVCMHVSMDVNMGMDVVNGGVDGHGVRGWAWRAWMRGWVWISVDGCGWMC